MDLTGREIGTFSHQDCCCQGERCWTAWLGQRGGPRDFLKTQEILVLSSLPHLHPRRKPHSSFHKYILLLGKESRPGREREDRYPLPGAVFPPRAWLANKEKRTEQKSRWRKGIKVMERNTTPPNEKAKHKDTSFSKLILKLQAILI